MINVSRPLHSPPTDYRMDTCLARQSGSMRSRVFIEGKKVERTELRSPTTVLFPVFSISTALRRSENAPSTSKVLCPHDSSQGGAQIEGSDLVGNNLSLEDAVTSNKAWQLEKSRVSQLSLSLGGEGGGRGRLITPFFSLLWLLQLSRTLQL